MGEIMNLEDLALANASLALRLGLIGWQEYFDIVNQCVVIALALKTKPIQKEAA